MSKSCPQGKCHIRVPRVVSSATLTGSSIPPNALLVQSNIWGTPEAAMNFSAHRNFLQVNINDMVYNFYLAEERNFQVKRKYHNSFLDCTAPEATL